MLDSFGSFREMRNTSCSNVGSQSYLSFLIRRDRSVIRARRSIVLVIRIGLLLLLLQLEFGLLLYDFERCDFDICIHWIRINLVG